ncbi:MAG: hypothetical protein ACOYVF_07420 [Candidatus Zixiibacteriota bacterium]
MTLKAIKLQIQTPTGPLLPGRGFYQLEEDALYVQIAPFSREFRFYSFLESEDVHLDLDNKGRLLFFELSLPRRRWSVDPGFRLPEFAEPADIRWLDFRDTFKNPTVTTNASKTAVKLTFSPKHPTGNYLLGDAVFLQTDDSGSLIALYVIDIIDDLAGQEIAAYRHAILKEKASTSTANQPHPGI